MKIYEIDNAITALIDEETGEITDIEALKALEMERDRKVANVACLIKNEKALADAIKAEKQALEKRQKALENNVERLKGFLLYVLGGTKFENDRCKVSYMTRDKVEIDEGTDVNALPLEFVKVTKDFNKTAIKDAINAGQEIEGCRVIKNTSVIVK